MINHQYSFIFIHLERCGGTSIEDVFLKPINLWNTRHPYLCSINYDNGSEKHVNIKYAKIIYERYYYQYRKFCIVRHPYSMFRSKCYWYDMKDTINHNSLLYLINIEKTKWHINDLYDFIGPKAEYDYVVKYENLSVDYKKMLNIIGIDDNNPKFVLPHIHKKSDNIEYKDIQFTEKALDIINRYCNKYAKEYDYELI